MARAEIPVGYAEVAVHGQYDAASWVNVFYVEVTPADGKTPAEIGADIAEAFHALYEGLDAGNFSENWHVSYISSKYRADTSSVYRFRIADAFAGTDSGTDEAAQVSYLINWGTTDPRKGGKARQYLAGVASKNMADSASLTTDAVSSMSADLDAWLVDLAAAGWTNGTAFSLVEMSFVDGKADRSTPEPYPIFSGTISPVVATQRRRVDRLRPS